MTTPSTTVMVRFCAVMRGFLAVSGKFFNAARIVRVPVAMTVAGAVLLVLPPQTSEVYRVIAQDMLYTYFIRCPGGIFTIECPRFALLRETLFACLGVLGAALAIWYTGCRLASTFWPNSPNSSLEQTILRWAPTVLACTLIIAAAYGIYASIPFHVDDENADILKAIAEHKAIARDGAQVTATGVDRMLRIINFLALPAGIMKAMAGLLAIMAVCILVLLPRVL